MKKIILLSSVVFVFAACQTSKFASEREPAADAKHKVAEVKPKQEVSPEVKKAAKTYMKNLSVSERNAALQMARVTSTTYDIKKVPSIDIISELQNKCGDEYKYQKVQMNFEADFDGNGARQALTYFWPKLTCTYRQDVEKKLGGGTEKFECDFPGDLTNADDSDDIDTRKVKHVRYPDRPLESEGLEVVLATTVSRLLGFYAETYCPAEITCKGCPSSNPWRNDGRSSGSPSHRDYKFPIAMVEHLVKGMTMSNKDIHPYVQGVEFAELRQVNPKDPQARAKLIEREAWMLWLNFIQHTDAGSYNERLSCVDVEYAADGKPTCKDSVVYTHDYGHSFYKNFTFRTWSKRSPLQANKPGQACLGNMTKDDLGITPSKRFQGVIFSPAISSEARDLLVTRLEAITDQQWATAYQLSKMEEIAEVSTADFLKVLKQKISQLKSANCLPFDSGTSVLAQKQ